MFRKPTDGEISCIECVVHMHVYVNVYTKRKKKTARDNSIIPALRRVMLGNAVGFPPQDGTNSVRSTGTNVYLLLCTQNNIPLTTVSRFSCVFYCRRLLFFYSSFSLSLPFPPVHEHSRSFTESMPPKNLIFPNRRLPRL